MSNQVMRLLSHLNQPHWKVKDKTIGQVMSADSIALLISAAYVEDQYRTGEINETPTPELVSRTAGQSPNTCRSKMNQLCAHGWMVRYKATALTSRRRIWHYRIDWSTIPRI